MTWLTSQSSHVLTCMSLVHMVFIVYFVHQVLPVQYHLYTMVLQSGFPPCFLKNQILEDLIWAVAATQCQMKCILENSQVNSLWSHRELLEC